MNNTANVKICKVHDSTITLTSNKQSVVFEYVPEDCEQKNEGQKLSYFLPIVNFLNKCDAVRGKFSSVKLYKLDGKNYINCDVELLSKFPLTTKKVDNVWEYFYRDENPVKTKIINKDDYVKIGDQYFRLFSFEKCMPEHTDINYLERLGDYVVFFKKTPKMKAVAKLEFKRNIFNSLINKEKKDVESDTAYKEADNLLEDIKLGRESHLVAEVFVILKSETEEELVEKTKALKVELSDLGCEYLIETDSLTKIFPTLFFGIEPAMRRSLPVKTSYLNNVLPLTRDFIHENGSTFYSRSLTPVNLNIFHPSSGNSNLILVGTSGSGKSFNAQKIVKDVFTSCKAGGIVFDLGYSFQKFAMYEGAKEFTNKFNPMQFKNDLYLQSLILSCIPGSELTEKLKGKILFLVKEAIREELSTFRELVSFLNDNIPDIKYYFEDLWGFITDDIEPIQQFIYVDVKHYPPRVIAPLLVYLIEYFDHIEGRRIFAFDEVWKFLETVGDYIEEKSRTIRKDLASMIGISQNVDDFLATKAGRAFMQNAFHKCIFNQTIVDKNFFNEEEKRKILECNTVNGVYSEFFYKSELSNKILRFYPTKFEYNLFASHKDHNTRLFNFFESFCKGMKFKESFDYYMELVY